MGGALIRRLGLKISQSYRAVHEYEEHFYIEQ